MIVIFISLLHLLKKMHIHKVSSLLSFCPGAIAHWVEQLTKDSK
jgi:hypothetical protein